MSEGAAWAVDIVNNIKLEDTQAFSIRTGKWRVTMIQNTSDFITMIKSDVTLYTKHITRLRYFLNRICGENVTHVLTVTNDSSGKILGFISIDINYNNTIYFWRSTNPTIVNRIIKVVEPVILKKIKNLNEE